MSVHETVAAIVAFTRSTVPLTPNEWWASREPLVWLDEEAEDRLHVARCDWTRAHSTDEWAAHPATLPVRQWMPGDLDPKPDIALASWALDDGALDAMLAAGVDAAYARAAHTAGVTDAWVIIGGWEAGIPVEYLGALS